MINSSLTSKYRFYVLKNEANKNTENALNLLSLIIWKNQYEQVIIHLSIKNQSIGLGILIKYRKNKWNIEWKNSCLSGHKN